MTAQLKLEPVRFEQLVWCKAWCIGQSAAPALCLSTCDSTAANFRQEVNPRPCADVDVIDPGSLYTNRVI